MSGTLRSRDWWADYGTKCETANPDANVTRNTKELARNSLYIPIRSHFLLPSSLSVFLPLLLPLKFFWVHRSGQIPKLTCFTSLFYHPLILNFASSLRWPPRGEHKSNDLAILSDLTLKGTSKNFELLCIISYREVEKFSSLKPPWPSDSAIIKSNSFSSSLSLSLSNK